MIADWWANPDFVINELNVQSIITSPAHDEVVPLAASSSTTYAVKGFAYSGGVHLLTLLRITGQTGEAYTLSKVRPV